MRSKTIPPLIILLAVVLAATACQARNIQPFSGKVVSVADGDTVTVLVDAPGGGKRQIRVRLYGIDAPEKRQDFGQRSRQLTADMVAGKIATVVPVDVDRYGRTVGLVFPGPAAGGQSVNAALLASGLAWVYPQYCRLGFCDAWKDLEAGARECRIGLWSHPRPLPPWAYRKK